MQRLQNIYKEIEYISKQGDLAAAFKDDTKRKAIFATFTDIAHNFKGIANSNDSEILALFSEQEKRQITGTRNVSAHGSENVAINAAIKYVKFTLVPLGERIGAFLNNVNLRVERGSENKASNNRAFWVFVAFAVIAPFFLLMFVLLIGEMLFLRNLSPMWFVGGVFVVCMALAALTAKGGKNSELNIKVARNWFNQNQTKTTKTKNNYKANNSHRRDSANMNFDEYIGSDDPHEQSLYYSC